MRATCASRSFPSASGAPKRPRRRAHGPKNANAAGAAVPSLLPHDADRVSFARSGAHFSDLGAALEALSRSSDERPQAIVVLSDGRLDRPGETNVEATIKAELGSLDVPVHTLALAEDVPADASIRAVRAAGSAVAHQPFSLRIDVGCEKLDCGDIPVVARELREKGASTVLASGTAHMRSARARRRSSSR